MLDEQPVADTTAVWSRLKGVHGLSFASQCAALALVRWREAAAQTSDRPRRWLLADEVLIAIAAELPNDAAALGALAPSKFMVRSAPALLSALASRTDPELQAEVRANAAQVQPDKATVKVAARARAPARRRAWRRARNPRHAPRPRRRRARHSSRPLAHRLARQRAGVRNRGRRSTHFAGPAGLTECLGLRPLAPHASGPLALDEPRDGQPRVNDADFEGTA